MQVVAGLLLAMPAWASPSIQNSQALQAVKTQLENVKADTSQQKDDVVKECTQEQQNIQGRIGGSDSKKKTLQDESDLARAAAEKYLASAQAAKATYAKKVSELTIVKKDLVAVSEHHKSVISKSREVVAQLSVAIGQGERVLGKLGSHFNGDKSASAGVVTLCNELMGKMRQQLLAHNAELKQATISQESESRTLSKQVSSLGEELSSATSQQTRAMESKAKADKKADSADKELAEVKKSLEVDRIALSTKVSDCTQRQSELNKMLDGLQKFDGEFVSVFAKSGTSFFQSNVIASMKRKAVALLQGRGSSPVFHKIVALLSATGPFDQVANIIREAIVNLEAQIDQHTSNSEYCTKGLAENELHRTTHAADIRKQRTKYEEIKGQNEEIKGQIMKANTDAVDTTHDLTQATELREKAKMTNEALIKEYSFAESAVNEGVAALRESGLSDDIAGSLFAAIELIRNEFRKTIEQTEEQESADSSKFSLFRESSNKKSADRSQKIHNLEMDLQKGTQDLSAVRKQHESFMGLLRSNMDEFDGLKHKCLSAGQDVEERKAKRVDEIQSLKEALHVLGGE